LRGKCFPEARSPFGGNDFLEAAAYIDLHQQREEIEMQSKTLRSNQRGVTLIEVCATLAIASILAGTALPSWEQSKNKQQFSGTVSGIAAEVNLARSEAVSRREGVWLSFHQVAGGSCSLLHTGAKADCVCADGGQAVCTGGGTALSATLQGVHVHANVQALRFDPLNGTVTPAATIHVTHASGKEVQHKVNITGRVRSCSPQGAVAGVPAC
jgi:type IV fimbrial biogenesis protein FimT